MIYLLFSGERTLMSHVVSKATHGLYSHVEILLGETVIGVINHKGLRETPLKTYLKADIKNLAITEIPGDVEELRAAMNTLSKGRHWRAPYLVWGFLTGARVYCCSTLIDRAFQKKTIGSRLACMGNYICQPVASRVMYWSTIACLSLTSMLLLLM